MATVVAYFNATMETVATDYYTRAFDLNNAIDFHELKIDVAEKLDKLVGIATIDSKDVITWTVNGQLMADYADDVKTVLGKAYTNAATYNAISGTRTASRNAIMAVEYMNYDEATPLFTFRYLPGS
jgi:hypothetical protein